MLKNQVGFNTLKTELIFTQRDKIESIFISCDPLSAC